MALAAGSAAALPAVCSARSRDTTGAASCLRMLCVPMHMLRGWSCCSARLHHNQPAMLTCCAARLHACVEHASHAASTQTTHALRVLLSQLECMPHSRIKRFVHARACAA